MRKIGLLPKLILGITTGAIIGYFSNMYDYYLIVRLLSTFSGIFGNFLAFIVPLIIIAFVAPGIADLGKKAGKLLGITAIIAYASSVFAGILAFIAGKAILPNFISVVDFTEQNGKSIEPFFNIQMDPVMGVMSALVTAFILGLGMAQIKGKALLDVAKDFQEIIIKVVKNVLIPFIPIHIAGIFAKLAASGEIVDIISSFSVIYGAIILLQLVYIAIQYLIAGSLSRKNPLTSFRNMLPAYFTALGTQSSAATIPVTLQQVEKNGIKKDVADFVVPLCATIHLAGDTITLVISSMAIMMMSGTIPELSMILPFILMLGITMVAAPGIPGGGVMAALGLLESMLGFGSHQIGLMIAIHFAQDSFGTATNVTGDGAIAMVIDKVSDEKTIIPEEIEASA
ncbi:dicarboxylate/amino acid:cation symporter [Aureibacter tunicatorum]|uniref:Na+/H+-dicarboxylate symporter n=1 Tax=Aureibacter tunicatorum TaxID=866807 RepID=A0AAE4BTT7_9BACT|nr:dicarboxylate/amino acid:cation symporter [Aureibacter tunicatorum]MDR6240133.1 Na+/H+-dicarboxylate symporter [Aureibacter tunicatorum]BDD05986.1 sodium:proton antiporter [Aureibacter tunicatorum]